MQGSLVVFGLTYNHVYTSGHLQPKNENNTNVSVLLLNEWYRYNGHTSIISAYEKHKTQTDNFQTNDFSYVRCIFEIVHETVVDILIRFTFGFSKVCNIHSLSSVSLSFAWQRVLVTGECIRKDGGLGLFWLPANDTSLNWRQSMVHHINLVICVP